MGVNVAKQSIDLGIVTSNGPAMLAFYRDLLGLPVKHEMPMPGGGAHMYQLACGESMIKLVVSEKEVSRPTPGAPLKAGGYRYWTITVRDLTALLAAISAAGAKVVVPERALRPGVHIAIVEDPDGNWVEFLSLG